MLMRRAAVIDDKELVAFGGFELTELSFGCCALGALGVLCVSAKVAPPWIHRSG